MCKCNEWISVHDMIPPDDVSMLVYPYWLQKAGILRDGEWYCEEGHPISPTHWMPLPPPPEK